LIVRRLFTSKFTDCFTKKFLKSANPCWNRLFRKTFSSLYWP